ncbi:hypothetical protein CC030809_00081 [Synechococcus phage S-CAM7]|uniref:Uncharacterized protein n=1 Tax=Synechococcus phage S-CAM7 TaxID=1883368 RepID=A0A7D5G698_9CAUD|nr:hypothetical protein CC030809_00081 [Synechococcus phage S-CAM7]
MKTSHTVLISATTASAFVIGKNYAPRTTWDIFIVLLLTAIMSLMIQFVRENS